MKKFVVERNLPGAENLSPQELQAIAEAFCEAIGRLGKPHYWLQSFITTDKIYCIHIGESEEEIRQHARLCQFPVHTISEVKLIIDPLTASYPHKG
jgi:hypothetical protein